MTSPLKRKRRMLRGAAMMLALGAIGFAVAASGIIPVKASSGHWAVTEWFLRFAMRRSTATHSVMVDVPALDNPGLLLKGAMHYEFGCRSCHGAPGEPMPRIAQSMLPRAPDLGPRIRASNAKKLFHVVKHGLKLTGMPAWPAQARDDEVWAVVAFLLKLPELDRAGYRELTDGPSAPTAPIQTLAAAATEPRTPAAVSRTCSRCHGVDGTGRGSGVFPSLAGQRREYLHNALAAYVAGKRPSGIMEPIATGLDDAIVSELADYYARLQPRAKPEPAAGAGGAMIELGRRIAHEGIPPRRVPACIECHGPTGRRMKPEYPSLAGQPAAYLVLQLELFKSGQRGGSRYAHLMQQVAPRLEAEEMRAVAAYFEGERER